MGAGALRRAGAAAVPLVVAVLSGCSGGRMPDSAVAITEAIAEAMPPAHPLVLDAMAAAHAANGTFGLAARIAEDAAGRAETAGAVELANRIRARLALDREGRAYTEPIR